MRATAPQSPSSYRAPGPCPGGRVRAGWLILVYLVMIAMGIILLSVPGAMVRGNELSLTDAAFASINAATLTGFEPRIAPSQYTLQGQWTILGLMAGGTVISLVVGGVLVGRIIGLAVSDVRVAGFAGGMWAAGVGLGSLALWQPEGSMLEALFLACSALGNCGLTLGNPPPAEGFRIHAVVLPLAFAGALGAPVILELLDRMRGRQRWLSTHARIAVVASLALYIVGAAGIGLAEFANDRVSAPREALVASSAASLDARTGGMGITPPDQTARATQWVMMAIMVIGGASGGTAGGVKTTTCAQIALGTRRALRGIPTGRALGIALTWIGTYAGLVFVGMVALLSAQPQIPADRMIFEVVSAASNVGLSYGPISMVGPGMLMLCALMLAGRFLPLLVLLWMARTTRDGEIAVG